MRSSSLLDNGFLRPARLQPLRSIVLIVLFLGALLSLRTAIKEARVGGIDFQWSGAHILGEGRDPWITYLSGDAHHEILLGQQPNYLPEFYELLGPLGAMQFSRALLWWCAINLLLLATTLAMVCKLFALDRYHATLLVLLTLCATPFRVTMANGQHGIFILFLLTALYYVSSLTLKGLALGLSYSKYSFSPLFVLVALVRRRWSVMLISFIPPAIGLLFAWKRLGGSLISLATEPLKTSRVAMGPGYADIMTPVELLLHNAGLAPGLVYLLPTLLGLGAAVAIALWIGRATLTGEQEFSLIILFTLLCFKHVIYDYVVLLVPVASLLAARRSRARTLGFVSVAYFWFGSTVQNKLRPGLHLDTALLDLACLLTLCTVVARIFFQQEVVATGDPEHEATSMHVLQTN